MSAGKDQAMNTWHTELKAMRVQAGLTQGDLADRLGLAQTTVSSYEVGRRFPTTDLVDRWAEECGGRVEIVQPGSSPLGSLPPGVLADLRELASGWESLPVNTRQAILLLAKASK